MEVPRTHLGQGSIHSAIKIIVRIKESRRKLTITIQHQTLKKLKRNLKNSLGIGMARVGLNLKDLEISLKN
jgi:phage I-like protein